MPTREDLSLTKSKEIREVIDAYTDDECLYLDKACAWCGRERYCASDNDAYTCLMGRLGELGVVIKVDRELNKDDVPCGVPCDKCVAVENLIDVGKPNS